MHFLSKMLNNFLLLIGLILQFNLSLGEANSGKVMQILGVSPMSFIIDRNKINTFHRLSKNKLTREVVLFKFVKENIRRRGS